MKIIIDCIPEELIVLLSSITGQSKTCDVAVNLANNVSLTEIERRLAECYPDYFIGKKRKDAVS